MDEYIGAMCQMQTSGLDITILILCEMLQLCVIMMVMDHMWKSHDVDVGDNGIIYMLMFKGNFIIQINTGKKTAMSH